MRFEHAGFDLHVDVKTHLTDLALGFFEARLHDVADNAIDLLAGVLQLLSGLFLIRNGVTMRMQNVSQIHSENVNSIWCSSSPNRYDVFISRSFSMWKAPFGLRHETALLLE